MPRLTILERLQRNWWRGRVTAMQKRNNFAIFQYVMNYEIAVLLALLLAGASTAEARPLTPAEGRYWPFSGNVPACDHEGVLGRIQNRFGQREVTYWKSGLLIQEFKNPRETGLRAVGVDLIPKRNCTAKAIMNDGKVRQVTYAIIENQGIIGWGWGVSWCIAGLDHHRAFGPNCSAASR